MEINRCLYLDAQHKLQIVRQSVPQPGSGQVLVKIAANGICGSDVHFFHEGRLGNFVVTTPYIPGHEASGVIVACGEGAGLHKPGTKVVIEPGIPCGRCRWCKNGRYNLCPHVVFLSAPPINGTFCDYVTIDEHFVFPVPQNLSLVHAALAEPAAVAVQAVKRAAFQPGATGVIVGAGPIGLLCLQAFKAAGGGYAICIDSLPFRRQTAKKLGADEAVDPVSAGISLQDAGDVVFEAAGSAAATANLFRMARPGARVVQVGWPNGNVVPVDIAQMMEKEIDYIGVNRYANAFETALTWLAEKRIDAEVLITRRFAFEQGEEAFEWALNHPEETIKVMVLNGEPA